MLLDADDRRRVWSWPSYLSYCEGTILDYLELRQVFDVAVGSAAKDEHLYRRSYSQLHKRIVPPFHLREVLGRSYARSAPIGGVVCARLEVGHAGLTVLARRRTSEIGSADISAAVFDERDDPDFSSWHGLIRQVTRDSVDLAIDWLHAADVPYFEIVLDPVLGKPELINLLAR